MSHSSGFHMIRFGAVGCALALVLGLAGCSGWNGASAPQYMQEPGQYAPPTTQGAPVRAGIPAAQVGAAEGLSPAVPLAAAASDELVSLLNATGRVDPIERVRLHEMLAARSAANLLEAGRVAHPVVLHDIDYLLVPRIDSIRVTRPPAPAQLSVAGVEDMLHLAKPAANLLVQARTELLLIDPAAGVTRLVVRRQFNHLASPRTFGLKITDQEVQAAASPVLGPDDTHRVLRLVLDDAVRDLLPKLAQLPAHAALATAVSGTPAASARAPTTRPLPVATVICPECGAKVPADAEFCPNCGHKMH